MKRLLSAFPALFGSKAAHGEPPEILENRTIGLKVVKPAGWVHFTTEANAENLRNLQMDDDAMQAAVVKYATAPIFAFTKYPEPYDDVNPSFKINLRSSGQLAGSSAKDAFSAVVPSLYHAFPDMVIQQGVIETTISRLPAAYLQFAYTLSANDKRYPTTSQLWIVPRGGYFFLIGTGTRQDEATGSRHEIRSIIRSIVITPLH